MSKIVALLGLGILLYIGGCLPDTDPAPMANVNPQPCYQAAGAQLSPQWAQLNKVQRAALAFSVINACEGGQP